MEQPLDRTADADRAHQLTRVSRAFTNARSLDEILHLAVEQAAQMLGTDKAVLMLADDNGSLRVRAVHGIDPAIATRFENPLDESLASRLRSLLGDHVATGFVGVPVISRGNVVGLLAAVRPDGAIATEDDEWVMSALADQVAAPLENARLATQLERSALLADNVRLYESERDARIFAETALRAAEVARDAALQADQTKSLFLAAMSHELRTPLNAIGGYAELLALELRGPITPEQAADLQRIQASQRHLLNLIDEVLEYARLGAGHSELQVTDFDINPLLAEAGEMVAPQVTAKGLHYLYVPNDGPVVVRADARRVKQIVLNLLGNAIKFTERGGSIRMNCDVGSDESRGGTASGARVTVTDTGRGIPADQLDAIWKPFVQVGRTHRQPAEGVGLGLAISRDLARKLGGDISAVSEPGRGSTFMLVLPLAKGSEHLR
ncbi:MAG: GAF domain-containing sensor histidine kinase [Gemmatimonadaceae bacterium]